MKKLLLEETQEDIVLKFLQDIIRGTEWENKVYLAVANRTGIENRNEQDLVFNGQSKIYAYNGSVMSEATYNGEDVITAEIEPQKTRNKSFNDYNDIFTDRRPQFYL